MLLSLAFSVLALASTSITAEYEVPVPPELVAYSRFELGTVKVSNEGGQVRIRYKLPLLLTGLENKIEMIGSRDERGVLRLSGEYGSAECDGFQEGQQCRLVYQHLQVDLARSEAELDKLGLSEADRAALLQVIKRFQGADKPKLLEQVAFLVEREGGDMQGIIHFGKPVEGDSAHY